VLKLFYSPGACSLASHVALEEAGADYETVRIDFKSGEQRSPDYLRINPKGRVPALSTARGILTENPVILGYIAQTHPAAKLAPNNDSFAFGDMQAFNLFLCATVHPTFAHIYRPTRYADGDDAAAAMKAKALSALDEHFSVIESRLADGRAWLHGEAYTVSDPYLLVFSRWLRRDGFGDRDRFPLVFAHLERLEARPAVRKVLAAEGL
jgi:glutathione S-transferase